MAYTRYSMYAVARKNHGLGQYGAEPIFTLPFWQLCALKVNCSLFQVMISRMCIVALITSVVYAVSTVQSLDCKLKSPEWSE